MGPAKAAALFREQAPTAASYEVTLFGSLAATGKGHLTDVAITDALAPVPVIIIWKPEMFLPEHPNGMEFTALDAQGKALLTQRYFSVVSPWWRCWC